MKKLLLLPVLLICTMIVACSSFVATSTNTTNSTSTVSASNIPTSNVSTQKKHTSNVTTPYTPTSTISAPIENEESMIDTKAVAKYANTEIITDTETDENAAMSPENQLAVIIANRDLWFVDTDYEFYNYTVTDLDQNGRLELIASSVQGTGFFTYTSYYEINETGNALEKCSETRIDESSETDFSSFETWPVYYDTTSDTYYYITKDYVRINAEESFDFTIALSLKNSAITEDTLGYNNTLYNAKSETETAAYFDKDSNKINKDAYLSLAEDTYSSLKPMSSRISWILHDSITNTTPEEVLYEILLECYEEFKIKDI